MTILRIRQSAAKTLYRVRFNDYRKYILEEISKRINE
nr:MAG TPA: hypothetical protein [Caudoviricetes sp.]